MPGLKIGNFELKSSVVMAPMAGYTDAGFRRLCRIYGAGLTYTEMVSMKGLKYDSARTKKMLVTDETEKPSAVQIFGAEPDIMGEMCKSAHIGIFDIVDINMGCPVPKVTGNNEGCALMRDIKLAESIIAAVRKALDENSKNKARNAAKQALTVKFRLGWDENHMNAREFAKMCENAGADAVTVHGRTRAQGYGGKADLNGIADVAGSVKIPVIGNGDVKSLADAERMTRLTGCAGVMIGRGALGKPYIFSDAPPPEISGMVTAHINALKQYFPDLYIAKTMRKHIAHYLKDVPDSKKLRVEINKMTETDKIIEILKECFL